LLCTCYNVKQGTSKGDHLSTTSKASPRLPVPSLGEQEALFAPAFRVLEDAISARAFPGAAVAVTRGGNLVVSKGVGRFTYENGSPLIAADTIYDLASVSKVVATTAMAMILYERGELDLEIPVASVVPEFAGEDPRRDEITVHMLLAHSSGLPAYVKLFEQAHTADELMRAALRVDLTSEPGARVEYSDIGFIILGELLARLSGESLDHFCRHEIFGPLGMAHSCFNPPLSASPLIPPTVNDTTFLHRVIQGEVHDENASVLGGVAGHAGVFAPATDLAAFAHCMLSGGAPILRPQTVALFTRRELNPAGTSRALGWDTPSSPSQSGRYFSSQCFGHLGYTGTSLWIDPSRALSVTLLTNRTWPDNKNQAIKQVRPQFHDAIIECLEAQR
jgi:serine-type D-Ala-D-Ala carboxypeptidase